MNKLYFTKTKIIWLSSTLMFWHNMHLNYCLIKISFSILRIHLIVYKSIVPSLLFSICFIYFYSYSISKQSKFVIIFQEYTDILMKHKHKVCEGLWWITLQHLNSLHWITWCITSYLNDWYQDWKMLVFTFIVVYNNTFYRVVFFSFIECSYNNIFFRPIRCMHISNTSLFYKGI